METYNKNLNYFFYTQLEDLKCDEDTKSYIVSVLDKFKSSSLDYSKDSLTILYADAKFRQDFYTFQNIGDWLFMMKVIHPRFFNNYEDYYNSIAKFSYYNCYRIIPTWKIFELLADEFIVLTGSSRKLIFKNNFNK